MGASLDSCGNAELTPSGGIVARSAGSRDPASPPSPPSLALVGAHRYKPSRLAPTCSSRDGPVPLTTEDDGDELSTGLSDCSTTRREEDSSIGRRSAMAELLLTSPPISSPPSPVSAVGLRQQLELGLPSQVPPEECARAGQEASQREVQWLRQQMEEKETAIKGLQALLHAEQIEKISARVAEHELWLRDLRSWRVGQQRVEQHHPASSAAVPLDADLVGRHAELEELHFCMQLESSASNASTSPGPGAASEELPRIRGATDFDTSLSEVHAESVALHEHNQGEASELRQCLLREKRMVERVVSQHAEIAELQQRLRHADTAAEAAAESRAHASEVAEQGRQAAELRAELRKRDAEIETLQEQQLRMADALAEEAEQATERIRSEEEKRRSMEVAQLVIQVRAAELRAMEFERQLEDERQKAYNCQDELDNELLSPEDQTLFLSVRSVGSAGSQRLEAVAEDPAAEAEATAEAAADVAEYAIGKLGSPAGFLPINAESHGRASDSREAATEQDVDYDTNAEVASGRDDSARSGPVTPEWGDPSKFDAAIEEAIEDGSVLHVRKIRSLTPDWGTPSKFEAALEEAALEEAVEQDDPSKLLAASDSNIQAMPLPIWTVDQTFEVKESDSNKAMHLQKHNSVSATIEELQQGSIRCDGGMCLVYSNAQEKYFCLFRSDKMDEAHLLFMKNPVDLLEEAQLPLEERIEEEHIEEFVESMDPPDITSQITSHAEEYEETLDAPVEETRVEDGLDEANAPVEYVASGEDELDQALASEVLALGPGALKGHLLTRSSTSKYKLGDRRVFMKLDSGAVTVRSGADYMPLNAWLNDLDPAESTGDLFAALDTNSAYAQQKC